MTHPEVTEAGIHTAVRQWLHGLEVDEEVLENTPDRVVRALDEMTRGYRMDPAKILAKRFEVDCDELVVVRNVVFSSLCEHHLLPFYGTVTVGYLPGKGVAGLSKLPRLVECFARRLQVQERLTSDIADALMKHLSARGAGVVIKASHACMAHRGVGQRTAEMVTSALRGVLRDEPDARAEFLALS